MSEELIPMILGKGRAGQAIQYAFSMLKDLEPDLLLQEPQFLKRGEWFEKSSNAILCFANPNALHAAQILRADREGFRWIISEKPICVNAEESEALDGVKAKVAVLHVYRQMWGPLTIKHMIETGELGEIINIEGRYWHSSAAEAALQGKPHATSGWKNDPKLCGPHDVLLDVGTHWLDMVCFLLGSFPTKNEFWLSYKNAERPHRDTHLILSSEFSSGQKTLGSISKTTHGMSDFFEFHVIGTRKMLSWNFIHPDEIIVGEGRRRSILVRQESRWGSKLPPFRGSGWLEGYIEVIRQFIYEVRKRNHSSYPDLPSVLPMMKSLWKK